MATETTNLHLTKPSYEDLADVSVINDNMDTIDAAVGDLQSGLADIGTSVYTQPSSVSCAASGWTTVASIELQAGTWLIIGGGAFAANATGSRTLGFTQDNASNPAGRVRVQIPAVASSSTNISMSVVYVLSSSKTIYLKAAQNSGGSLECSPWIDALRLA